jgi:hypothetical protein
MIESDNSNYSDDKISLLTLCNGGKLLRGLQFKITNDVQHASAITSVTGANAAEQTHQVCGELFVIFDGRWHPPWTLSLADN